MKRTHKMLTVMGLVLPVLYFGSAGEAAAFCIHNWTDQWIRVEQVHGGTHVPFKKFTIGIKPGHKSCCNWQTHDCNTEGKKHSKVKFDISYELESGQGQSEGGAPICVNYAINANGKIVVHGRGEVSRWGTMINNNYTCKKE